jgi:peptide chain release factor 3
VANLADIVAQRRTFAIISHPDAGKTTLTEKLLLFGGAIQLAGAVKVRGQQRRARSDWLAVEQERGISVSSSVMSYEYQGRSFNLLDTPGHADFSEDTYRTLTAVDSAVMVLDSAKGIESQTRKLFEVCRTRDVPIITFINKLDREGRDAFELLDEIEQTLQLEVSPVSWPIGRGQRFHGVYDLQSDALILMDRADKNVVGEALVCRGLDDPTINARIPEEAARTLREEVEMARELCPPFDVDAYRAGDMTPVFFGSALNNFGVRELLDGIAELAPPPRPQPTRERRIEPTEQAVTGFVFKIQANMDPKHRDRVAFVRLCSGHFTRGARLQLVRTGKAFAVHNPMIFVARDRELAEEAWAGDIIGIPNHGNLRIGDALTEGEELHFTGIPSFAPELIRRVRTLDPMRAKHLGRALVQLAEEGAAKVFKRQLGGEWLVGVVGALQFDVISARIKSEYEIPVTFESASLETARWIEAPDRKTFEEFAARNVESMAEDHGGLPVFLARNQWQLDRTARDWPAVKLLDAVAAN